MIDAYVWVHMQSLIQSNLPDELAMHFGKKNQAFEHSTELFSQLFQCADYFTQFFSVC